MMNISLKCTDGILLGKILDSVSKLFQYNL